MFVRVEENPLFKSSRKSFGVIDLLPMMSEELRRTGLAVFANNLETIYNNNNKFKKFKKGRGGSNSITPSLQQMELL